MKSHIIYCVTNLINNKKYIGKTSMGLKKRMHAHHRNAFYSNSPYPFHRALRKYGKNSFDWSVICECRSEKELNRKEKLYIKKFDTMHVGYNLSAGGDGNLGYKHTEKMKKHLSKMSTKALIGHFVSKESREKMRMAKLGKKRSKESIQKQILHANPPSYWKGKHLSKSHREAISKGGMGKKKPGTSLAMKLRRAKELQKKRIQENAR